MEVPGPWEFGGESSDEGGWAKRDGVLGALRMEAGCKELEGAASGSMESSLSKGSSMEEWSECMVESPSASVKGEHFVQVSWGFGCFNEQRRERGAGRTHQTSWKERCPLEGWRRRIIFAFFVSRRVSRGQGGTNGRWAACRDGD